MTDTVPQTGNPHADRTNLLVETSKQRCNHCKALILWARTEATHDATRMPVDYPAAAVGDGNVLLVHDDRWGLVATVLGTRPSRAAYEISGWRLYLHHRLSCPHADKWARSTPPTRRPASRPAPRRSRA